MSRRVRTLVALVVLAALALGACGGSTAPELTDPKEIITKAVEALQKAKSAHLEVSVEGTLKADLTGSGSSGGMSLAGTTFGGDIDVANEKAHLSAAVPAFLGLTADIIVIGEDVYTKVSLSGDMYEKTKSSPTDPTDPAKAISEIKSFLDKPEIAPTKKDDASCGSKKCYQIVFDLTAAELATLMPDQTIGDATVTVTLLIEKDTLYLASASVTIAGDEVGEITIKLTMSNWDEPVTIEAPPADQVK